MQVISGHEITSYVLKLIELTRRGDTVYLVTPYLDMSEHAHDAVRKARKAGAKVVLVVRRNDVKPWPERDIKRFLDNGSMVYPVTDLHAKIYWTKQEVIVTSMNLRQSAMVRNREVGIVIREADKENELIKQLHAVINDFITSVWPAHAEGESTVHRKGWCIACGAQKTFNPEFPICDNCWSAWAAQQSVDRGEKFCHVCGKEHRTTYARPLCDDCISNLRLLNP
jgi:phosphatidylserine/phosphatidylglycerophosphate/cardiolipin synthase-like enzyme